MSQTYLYLDPQFAPTFARVLGFDAFVSGSQRARARVPAGRERQVSVACTRCARFPFPVVCESRESLVRFRFANGSCPPLYPLSTFGGRRATLD